MSSTSPSRHRHHPVELLKERAAELETINEQLRTEIAERKRAEEVLRGSEHRLRKAQQIAHFGSWVLDVETNRVEFSDEMFNIFGITREQFVGTPEYTNNLVQPEDRARVQECYEDLLTRHKPTSMEYSIIRPDGSVRHLWGNGEVEFDEKGNLQHVVGTVLDITERKRAEEALEESLLFIQQIANAAPNIMIYLYDLIDRRNVFVTGQIGHILGYTQEDIQQMGSKMIELLVHPHDLESVLKHMKNVAADTKDRVIENEYRMRHANGEWHWLLSRDIVFARDGDGSPRRNIGMAIDITERKRAEEALKESEGKLRFLLENIPDLIMNVDSNHKITFINRGVPDVTVEQVVGTKVYDYIEPAHREIVRESLERVFQTGTPERYEVLGFGPKGPNTAWYETRVSPNKVDDQVISVTLISSDITDRKKAEEALRESEERYRQLVELFPDTIAVHSEGKIVYINTAGATLVRAANAEKLIGKSIMDFLHPDYRKTVEERVGELREGKKVPVIEEKFIRLDGTDVDVEVTAIPFIFQGKPAVQAVVRDITERKRAGEALQESEERYRSLVNNTNDLVYSVDVEGNIIFINPSARKFIGCEPEETIGHNFGEYVHPDDARAMSSSVQQVLRGEPLKSIAGVGPDMEFRMIKKDGEVIWATAKSLPIRDSQGEIVGFNGIIRDITERKEAEGQAFRQSAVLDAINRVFRETLTCETDEEVARVCLSVAEELTGSESGFIGEVNQSGRFDAIALSDPGWDTCEMPKLGAAVMLKEMEIRGIWGRVLKDRQSLIVNDPASHPDRVGTPEGHPHITAFLGVPLNWAGKTIGMIALANKKSGYNLTDQEAIEDLSVAFIEALKRKRAEEELKASLKEKEVLLKEVHHRVKNNLQVVSSLLYLQSEHIKDKHCLATIKESENRVRSMALVHEQLYQSEGLARVDFAEYIRNLATYLLRSHGVKPDAMTLKIDAEDVSLGIDTAIPCGLIISELISNSLEHAFPAGKSGGDRESEIRINLNAHDNKLTLIVSDNGVGLPGDLDFRNTESFGLHLVNTLVSQLEGTIELDRSGGTAFEITFAEK